MTHYRHCEAVAPDPDAVVETSAPFGGTREVILYGDNGQVEPVGENYLWEPPPSDAKSWSAVGAIGHAVFEAILSEHCVVLDRPMRQSPLQRRLRQRSAAIRNGTVTQSMWRELNARALDNLPPSERALFGQLNCVDLVCSNAQVLQRNVFKTLALGNPVARCTASGSGTHFPGDFQLVRYTFFCVGMSVVCTTNLQRDEMPEIVRAQVRLPPPPPGVTTCGYDDATSTRGGGAVECAARCRRPGTLVSADGRE